ncbi:MAG: patatin-like phospholipase family protein [Kofleriaceae bacterium]
MTADLGLALSGGGSRAAAFHRGTLRALLDLGLVDRVTSISSVSGGSVFAAAWMAARARGWSDERFLEWFHDTLGRGFIRPTIVNWRVIKWLWKSRTQLLADTFDRLLFDGVTFDKLPEAPRLVLNTTVLNNASAGRFSRDGYSGKGVGTRGDGDNHPITKIDGLTLGFATAASAAFPFGLPPLVIKRRAIQGPCDGFDKLVLTDGGILENLGIERLLQSGTFGARHILVSDAGARDRMWKPGFVGWLKGLAIFGLSAQQLDRLLSIMNDKQNRSMRQLLFARFRPNQEDANRLPLFVQLDNDWATVVDRAPSELVAKADLGEAEKLYASMNKEDGVAAANAVTTGFTGLSSETLRILETHARWQVHALVALYGAGFS